jgi:hypothetical protein
MDCCEFDSSFYATEVMASIVLFQEVGRVQLVF